MLRRTPLKRGKPLARGGPIARKTRLKRKRKKPRRGPKVDKAYRGFVTTLPCARCGRRPPSHPHHNTHGRGKGQKTDDDQCMPLCGGPGGCHDGLHDLNGLFKGWTRDDLVAWQAEMVAYTQTLHLVRVELPLMQADNTQTIESEEDAA